MQERHNFSVLAMVRHNSIAHALELHLPGTNPSIWYFITCSAQISWPFRWPMGVYCEYFGCYKPLYDWITLCSFIPPPAYLCPWVRRGVDKPVFNTTCGFNYKNIGCSAQRLMPSWELEQRFRFDIYSSYIEVKSFSFEIVMVNIFDSDINMS